MLDNCSSEKTDSGKQQLNNGRSKNCEKIDDRICGENGINNGVNRQRNNGLKKLEINGGIIPPNQTNPSSKKSEIA